MLAAKAGFKVVAFEPEPQNFSVFTMNIYLNELSDLIVPLNMAISDRILLISSTCQSSGSDTRLTSSGRRQN